MMIPNPQPPHRIQEAKTQEAQSDVGSPNIQQLLQKDLRIIRTVRGENELRLGVVSLLTLVEKCFSSDAHKTELERFCEDSRLIGVVLLGVSVREQPVRRDVGIYALNPAHVDTICSFLSEYMRKSPNSPSPSGTFFLNSGHFRYFSQVNSATSREHLLPVLQRSLDTISTGSIYPRSSIPNDDDDNETSLDNFATVVPPNSYAGEGYLNDSQSVLGRVSQRVQQMDASRSVSSRSGPESPMEAGTFDYDARERNEPFTPSNTYVEDSLLSREGAKFQSNHVGLLHKKVAHLKRRQDNWDSEAEEQNCDRDSEGSIFEMEDEVSSLPRSVRPGDPVP